MLACLGLLVIPFLYIPFRLVAQRYNIAFTATLDKVGNVYQSDSFAYPFAILIWPAFAALCGSVAPYIAKRIGAPWLVVIPLVVAAFVLTYLMPWVDELVGIPGGGLDGFVSWPVNHAGLNTPTLSAMFCPVLFWASAIVAVVTAGILNQRKTRNA